MSRSRSRAEKSKLQTSTPSSSTQIVFPEKITGADWSAFLDANESQDVAHQLCSELLDQTLTKIFDLYIQKQVIPYTVSQVEGALLQLLEMEFFAPDASEPTVEGSSSWLQDEVAQACPIDSWAQGAISKRSETVWWDQEDTDSLQTGTIEASNQDFTIRKLSANKPEEQTQKKISDVMQKKLNTTNVRKKSPKTSTKTSNVDTSTHKTVRSRREGKPNKQITTVELPSRETQDQKDSNKDKKHAEQHRREEERTKREASLTRQFIQQKACASGRFVFDDEGNLLSVPNITKPISQPTGSRKSHKTNNYFDRMVALKYNVTSENDHEKALSDPTRTVPLKASGKVTREVHNQSRIQEAERFRLVKATSAGLLNINDLIKLAPGVSISEGDKLRTGFNSLAGAMSAGDKRLQNLNQIPCLQEMTDSPDPLIELCPIRIVSQQ